MKVLWICGLPYQVQAEALDNRPHGASAAWSWIIAHMHPPANIDLHIACPWYEGSHYFNFEYMGATWHLLPTSNKHRTLTLFHHDRKVMKPFVHSLKPDVVHGWGTENSFGFLACLLSPEKHVVSVQGLIREYRRVVPHTMERRSFITELLEKFTLARARKVTVESTYSAEISRPLVRKGKVWQIDHPLRKEFLESDFSSGQGKNIVFIGSLNDRKGIMDAIYAVGALKDPAWTFTVIGDGSASYVSQMKEQVRKYNIENRTRFIPKASSREIIEIYQNSSVFLLPTKIDTGPTALKEAMSMGIWPICYDNSGPSGYVRDYQFGCLAEDGNLDDLAVKLEECTRLRPWLDLVDRAGLINTIRANFDREAIWTKMVEVNEYKPQERTDNAKSMMTKLLKKLMVFPDSVVNAIIFKYRNVHYDQKPIIHGKLTISGSGQLKFGKNVKINSNATKNPVGMASKCMFYIAPGAQVAIGSNVGISTSLFYAGTRITVEDDVMIGGGCQILDTDFHSINYSDRILYGDNAVKTSAVTIKQGAFIGTSCIILKGVSIGTHSVIAAGSVVGKPVPDGEIWGGNPARFIKKLNNEPTVC